MIFSDYHTHTLFCDGNSTPRQMVESAIEKGLKNLGFTAHSYTSIDESYCLPLGDYEKYVKEINTLKEEYKNKINILCAIEQDYYSNAPTDCFDYVIGSVHYLKVGERYIGVDESAEILINAVKDYYNGDFYSLCEDYYKTVACLANTNADIIGHFDLITKFNEKCNMFDEQNERYLKAAKAAANALILKGKTFEVNTGAISRGYKTAPYPNLKILEYILNSGGKIVLSSDAHSSDAVAFEFSKWNEKIKKLKEKA